MALSIIKETIEQNEPIETEVRRATNKKGK